MSIFGHISIGISYPYRKVEIVGIGITLVNTFRRIKGPGIVTLNREYTQVVNTIVHRNGFIDVIKRTLVAIDINLDFGGCRIVFSVIECPVTTYRCSCIFCHTVRIRRYWYNIYRRHIINHRHIGITGGSFTVDISGNHFNTGNREGVVVRVSPRWRCIVLELIRDGCLYINRAVIQISALQLQYDGGAALTSYRSRQCLTI